MRIKRAETWTPAEMAEALLYDIQNKQVSDKGGTPTRIITLVVSESDDTKNEYFTVYSCGMDSAQEQGYIQALRRRCMEIWYND